MKTSSLAVLLMLVLGTVGAPALPTPAGAVTIVGSILRPGHVVTATPVASMTVPADGRLRAQDFLGSVTGVAWPARTSADGHEVAAATGDRLVVFAFTLGEPGSDVTPVTPDLPALALDVGKDSLPVALGGIGAKLDAQFHAHLASASATYAAAVPDGTHHVVLSMTEGSFTQRFDLWTLRRLPPAPVSIYRAPTSPYVTASVTGSATLTITDPQTGLSQPVDVGFLKATLTDWAPDGFTEAAPAPTQTFLWVRLLPTEKRTGAIDTAHFRMHPLPGARLVFTPDGGAPVTASSAPSTGAVTTPTTGDGLFAAQYWFVVPAALTSGTLSVVAGPATGQLCTWNIFGACTPAATQTVGAATLALDFPDPATTPPVQHRPRWVGAPLPPAGDGALAGVVTPQKTGTTDPSRPTGGFPLWAAFAVLAGVAAAVFATKQVAHRRRGRVGASGSSARRLDECDAHSESLGVRVAGSPTADERNDVASDAPAMTPRGDAAPAVGSVERPGSPPALGVDGDLVVRVVGHVEIAGWTASSDRRLIMEDLCCFLALAERPMSTAEVQEAVWPLDGERGEATVKTVHNTIGRLRQAVGAEHFPDAPTAGGYRLQGVVTDWGEITRLLEAAAGGSAGESRACRLEALAHVRGAPFEGAHATQFHWAFVSGLVSRIARTLADCAHELSGELLDAGDASGAEWAARQGLRVSSTDERLWETAARAAAMLGTGASERVWRDAAAALGSAPARELRGALGS